MKYELISKYYFKNSTMSSGRRQKLNVKSPGELITHQDSFRECIVDEMARLKVKRSKNMDILIILICWSYKLNYIF